MERIKKARKPVRAYVSKLINTLELELVAEHVNKLVLQSSLQQLETQIQKLTTLDEKVIDALLDEDAQDDELKVNEIINPPLQAGSPTRSISSSSTTKRTCKLPKIEMKKFSGDLMEWLGWWAQIEKIHEDDELHDADKFQYLFMCMVPGTRAQELVDSYPQSRKNYPKVIAVLQQRFGNPKLLKQVYVRDLIRMIIVNKNKDKMNLTSVYDKLESHLRSLESLGVTVQQMIEFLYPMVESTLPEGILLAWQRSSFYGRDGSIEVPPKSELDILMTFLKQEIEHETQRKLAREGFGENYSEKKRTQKQREVKNDDDFPTAAGLFSGSNDKIRCIYCEKTHESRDCIKAQSMSMDAKKSKIQKSRACFMCFKIGHTSKKCRSMVRCIICGKRHQTLLCSEIVEELGFKSVQSTVLNHALFGGTEVTGSTHQMFDVDFVSEDQNFVVNVKEYDQLKTCGGLPRAKKRPWMAELKKRKIFVNDLNANNPVNIELLVGADVLGKILSGGVIQLDNGLSAIETHFGWTLMGQIKRQSTTTSMNVLSFSVFTASVAELWSLDTIGIRDPVEVKTREERELQTMQHFLNTVVKKEDGRYSVSLPWIAERKALPSNREVATRRLESTTKKLHVLDQLQDYDDVFQTWLNEGIISKVEDSSEVHRHFIPHRAVFKQQSKTTPVRPVFDASCKVGRLPSLNECLEKGPNLLELIPSILLRFRIGRIGVTSDIRKAFLIVEVNESDRNFISFLWYDKEKSEIPVPFQHNRIVFGMNCSPFLLGAVIQYHLSSVPEDEKKVSQKLSNSFYVDNCVTSVSTSEEYERFKLESTKIMADAKMELRQWEHSADGSQDSITSVLGLTWNKETDSLYCASIQAAIPPGISKRVILSIIHRFYDPLGFLCLAMLSPKLLLQRAWLENRKWNEEVSDELKLEFLSWWNETAQYLDKIHIPRNVTGEVDDQSLYQIHTFSDASKSAYATCVFLRVGAPEGVKVQLLLAKNRVAPVKAVTIPRLEFLSCSITARLTDTVTKALSLEQVPKFFWTDSSTALAWILRRDEWGTFVGNRVKEIRELTKLETWRHVPGVLNPADLPSRGSSIKKLLESRWWEGPDWLRKEPREWPNER